MVGFVRQYAVLNDPDDLIPLHLGALGYQSYQRECIYAPRVLTLLRPFGSL